MSLPPHFLIIGAARCGTTAMARSFEQHPEVFLTNPKEPHFFAFHGTDVNFRGPGDSESINRVSVTGVDRYSSLYSHASAKKSLGEGSVSTLYYHEQSIPNIRKLAPDVKLIAILRNPIERAWSSYMYMISKGHEPLQDFSAAIDDEQRRISENWHHIWHYTRMGFYSEQLREFQKAFPAEQLKVVLFDDLRRNPKLLYQQLFDFIGVDSSFSPNTDEQVNQSGKPKSRTIHTAIKGIGKFPVLKTAIKSIVPMTLRERLRNANLDRQGMPDSDRSRLAEIFREEIGELGDVLSRDLTSWLRPRGTATSATGV
jgi:hypothetical protein